MSYDDKRVNHTTWDEGHPGEPLIIWFGKDPSKGTYTLPAVHYKPGYEYRWIEDEWGVTLSLSNFFLDPEGDTRLMTVAENLPKNFLETHTVTGAEMAVEYFVASVTQEMEDSQREIWLRFEWPQERDDVEQSES